MAKLGSLAHDTKKYEKKGGSAVGFLTFVVLFLDIFFVPTSKWRFLAGCFMLLVIFSPSARVPFCFLK